MDRNNETIRLAKKAADAWRTTDTYHQAAQIIDMLISALEGDTTLTPPNEPLTLEDCERWSSHPVWWDYIPCWVLVRRGRFVFGSEPHKVETFLGTFTAARRRERAMEQNKPWWVSTKEFRQMKGKRF